MTIDAPKPRVWPETLPPMPKVEFSMFGEVEAVAVSRTQKFVAAFLSRNWAQIPHVTHNDEAPATAVDTARREVGATHGVKLSPLPFIVKAVVAALKEFPRFNSSLSPEGDTLILKKYFHIGIAVETAAGLVVPVIRDCDKKSVIEIAAELAEKAERARTKGLPMEEMSGGCFSISSISVGGTSFTPIINAPEVAILGVTRAQDRVRMTGEGSAEGYTALPLSLSYDHRVINGADAARFLRAIIDALANPMSLVH
ncbi:2-oxo acid dehydrogenase subunit E2 [Paraburkholderia sp. BR14374]|uniref:2-oxo acid dehydrogenase subunit E2 n=1 Tax=Paraburkholderia sp. BR14374 TaxID=3237007 RepID=UPI0034CD2E14